MKKLLFTLLIPFWIFAQNNEFESDVVTAPIENIFIDNTGKRNEACLPICRIVKQEYKTEITGFDAISGETRCRIYYTNGERISYNANTYNEKCLKDTNTTIEYGSGKLVSEGKQYTDVANVKYQEKTNGFTVGRYLGAMLTLDPEVIDFEATNRDGLLQLKDPNIKYGQGILDLGLTNKAQYVATSDLFSKANMGYYSKLFANMSVVYGYVQNLLFVFVGVFFIASLGYSKTANALEKQGEANISNTKWLKSFMTPVLAVGFFFAPIPEDAGMNATIVQKIIRYFVQQSITIADRASAIGVDAYMSKLYATVGATSVTTEKILRENLNKAIKERAILQDAMKICHRRYPLITDFQRADEQEILSHEKLKPNQDAENITFSACQKMEERIIALTNGIDSGIVIRQGIERAYANEVLQNKLTQINTQINDKQKEFGFITSLQIPAFAIVIEGMSIFQDNSIDREIQEMNEEKYAKLQSQKNAKFDTSSKVEKVTGEVGGMTGEVIGKSLYFMLPGSKGIYDLAREQESKVAGIFDGIPIVQNIARAVDGLFGGAGALYFMSKTYERILKYLPIIVSCVAGVIALISYVVKLAKWYYLTPFVVAWALTQRSTNKIVDYLVLGIDVFFRPILLTIFVFFAIFIHSLVGEVFNLMGLSQFDFLDNIQNEMGLSFWISLAKSLYVIVMQVACTWVMWKLILSGPSQAIQMVGVNGGKDGIIEGLASDLKKLSNPAS